MRNQVFTQEKDQLQSLLSQHSSVGIIVGKNPSLDTMGASLALYLALLDSGKQAQIISSTAPLVEISNLVAIDQVKDKFEGDTKTLVISVPYKEGEVEKVSFTTEGDRMNFNIVGGAQGITPFSLQDIQILRKGSSPELIIAVGVSHIEDLQALTDTSSNVKIVNIDNSQNNTFYGDVIMADPGFSSVSELVASVIDELGLPLDIDIAQNLLDGIAFSSKNFSAQNTSSFAFEAAGMLMRAGAQRKSEIGRVGVREEAQKLPRDFAQPQRPQAMQSHVQSAAPIQEPMAPRENTPFMNQPQMNNQQMDTNTNNNVPEEVPSDWFVPKVFKGSKNPNQ